jgi:hypothetical protein
MVVDGDGELFLGLVLSNDVFVKEGADFKRFRKMRGRSTGLSFAAVVLED